MGVAEGGDGRGYTLVAPLSDGEYVTVKDTADEPLVYRVTEVQSLR